RPPGREGAAPPDSGRGPYEQLMAIQSRVTRKDYRGRAWGENQKVKVEEALRICTLHGAHASFEEKVKGSITEGKLADFVVLAEDPHRVDPEKIKDIKVVRTVVGGRTVHPKGEGSRYRPTLLAELPERGRRRRRQIAGLMGMAPDNREGGWRCGPRPVPGGRAEERPALDQARRFVPDL